MEFAYRVRDRNGKLKTGVVDADNKAAANEYLHRRRWRILELNPIKKDIDGEDDEDEITPILGSVIYRDSKGVIQISPTKDPVPSAKILVIFSKHLATMIGSGVPLLRALTVLANQQTNKRLRRSLKKIKIAIENGSSFSQALEEHTDIFDQLYIAMIQAGEISGQLETTLQKLSIYIEKADKIKRQVKSALTYPTVVLVIAVVVVVGLLTYVVPTFAEQFAESGRDLPALTQVVIDLSDHLSSYLWVYFLVFGLAFSGFKYTISTPDGRLAFDRLLLKFPAIGDLLKKVAVGRFASTMANMLASGVNLLKAIDICAYSSGNKEIEISILAIRDKLEIGGTMTGALESDPMFPDLVVSMVNVGESTGTLDEMLDKISEFYEEEVDEAVKGLLSLIEPITIVLIGGTVGFIVIAMYLPIFDAASGMG